jgi:hypothetical protein
MYIFSHLINVINTEQILTFHIQFQPSCFSCLDFPTGVLKQWRHGVFWL